MLRNYETIYIVKGGVADDGVQAAIAKIAAVLENIKAENIKTEEWGRKRLAYPIQKQPEGFYVYIKFSAEADQIKELTRNYRIVEDIVRFQTIILEDKKAPKGEPKAPKREEEGGGRRFRRKFCRYCKDEHLPIDYKDARALRPFITERGKIFPRRTSGNCAKHQREVCTALKRARNLAILPYTAINIGH